LAQEFRQAYDDVRAPIALDELPSHGSAYRGAHGTLDVAGIQSVARQRLPIGIDHEHGQSGRLLDTNVGGSRHVTRNLGDA
jgi:hypothetical protein